MPTIGMDPLDRMYQQLVRVVRGQFPQYETESFDVAELYQTILPYRHNRRELALDSNDDYEILLTELLSGKRGYLVVDDRMRDALTAELASANPDPGAFKQFATAMVALAPEPMAKVARASASAARVSAAAPRMSAPAPRVSSPDVGATEIMKPAMSTPANPSSTAPVVPPKPKTMMPHDGDKCRSCNQALPVGREITFCPFCGQNVTTMNCLACGAELELGWKFCPVCGRPADAHR